MGSPKTRTFIGTMRVHLPLLIRVADGSASSGLFCMLDTMTVAFQNGGGGPRTTYVGSCESKRKET